MVIIPMSKKIYHRNDIRPVIASMNLPARRLLYICLSRLTRLSEKDDVIIEFNGSPELEIKISEYAQMCDIDYSAAYRQMVKGSDCLMTTQVKTTAKFLGDTSKPNDFIKPFTVGVYGTGYSQGEGYVVIKLAEQLKPFLSTLKKDFTGQFLLSAMRIPDGNASKLYLILREWISAGMRHEKIVSIDDLRESLAVSDVETYQSFKDFRKLFFLRSAKRVVERTEFTDVTMEIVERRARKAYKVKISYQYDSKSMVSNNDIVKEASEKKEINHVSKSSDKPVKRSAIDVLEEKIRNFDFKED